MKHRMSVVALLTGVVFAMPVHAVVIDVTNEQMLVDAPTVGWQVWPSEPPADCPFKPSPALGGVLFTGRHSDYYCGDTFYPSWAGNGNLYSPWTDGTTDGVGCSSGSGAEARTGHAVMIGDDPLKLTIKNTSLPKLGNALPYQGRYPCGSLVHDGIWYYGTYCLGPSGQYLHKSFMWNWPNLGPMPGFQISRDLGKTWEPSPHSPEKPLFPEPAEYLEPVKMGAPHFVDFGKNMEHSPDGKAYLLGMGAVANDPESRPCIKPTAAGRFEVQPCDEDFDHANLSWITADQVYLARVTPSTETINNLSAYEFFNGHDVAGQPVWTSDFNQIKPLIEWNNHMGCATATWVPGLKKYLMCITDGWPTVAKMDSYILESDSLTGPWRLVAYMKHFGEQGYFLNLPSKFISSDGKTLWLCYSANFSPNWNGVKLEFNPPGGRYGLCLHELRFLAPEEEPKPAPNPLQSANNVALQARVEVSSTHKDYIAQAAIDGHVDGYPGNIGREWATSHEGVGAWIKLSWDQPQTICRLQLFDRPNPLDQVTGGRLVFSDGSIIDLAHPLPDNATQGLEITFEPKILSWVKFSITAVKPNSPNIGLAEFAVFCETAD
ncbi:MAG: hypothetical protein JXA82_18060 [Sedimentisphaerales bacterium]|nr:hypothetical protein [Sedimentisphaerales bacterium]